MHGYLLLKALFSDLLKVWFKNRRAKFRKKQRALKSGLDGGDKTKEKSHRVDTSSSKTLETEANETDEADVAIEVDEESFSEGEEVHGGRAERSSRPQTPSDTKREMNYNMLIGKTVSYMLIRSKTVVKQDMLLLLTTICYTQRKQIHIIGAVPTTATKLNANMQ